MKKKYFITCLIVIGTLSLGSIFYFMIGYNYEYHKNIQKNRVDHPEGLPNITMAKITSFGFQNVRADWYWLQTIQYIGGNALGSEYKKYLYKILELVTGLNPYFEHPYVVGQLLLPSVNERYEKLNTDEQKRHLQEGEKIGLLGIKNFCDPKKIQEISTNYNLYELWTNSRYKDTCKSYEIPFYLAFIYYFYKYEPLTAGQYYRVASTHPEGPEGSKIMAAIMQGKGGEREKSIFMFLNLAKSFEKDNHACQEFIIGIENFMMVTKQNNGKIESNTLKKIEEIRSEILGDFNEKEESKLGDTTCGNYVNKAIRELNLLFIEQGNEKFKNVFLNKNARNAKVLFQEGFIDFLPTDFQQYQDYGIIYEYNTEIGKFDYIMGTYE